VVGARCVEDAPLRGQKSPPLAFLALPLVFGPCYKTLETDQVELLTQPGRRSSATPARWRSYAAASWRLRRGCTPSG